MEWPTRQMRPLTSVHVLGHRGFTGRLICEAWSRLHSAPVHTLDLSRTAPLAAQLDSLRAMVKPGDMVLNCLGPFGDTYSPVLRSCLATGAHYLDICAEWRVFEGLHSADRAARDAGIMLLPGIGFDVVASDCLAAHMARRLPDATRLQIGIAGLDLVSRGSARTIAQLVGEPVRVRRNRIIVADPRIRDETFDFGDGPTRAIAVSWGDVSTAYYTTGIPNVDVYFESTPATMSLAFANRTFGWMFRNPLLERTAQQFASRLRSGPSAAERESRRVTVVARATDANSRSVESRLVTNEAYTFTAQAACAVMQEATNGCIEPGFQTPGKLLGADFVLQIEGSKRYDV
jgi:short subunit dehydrogenase-like uncharacterized protein